MASYYCYDCLHKLKKVRAIAIATECPKCGGDLRKCKNAKTRAGTVTRLMRHRGLKPPTRKKRQSDYQKYLHSDLWNTIRTRVMLRDNDKCRECGKKVSQVHHLSYAPEVMAGHDDSQLVSLCRACHKTKHPDKQRRRDKREGGKRVKPICRCCGRKVKAVGRADICLPCYKKHKEHVHEIADARSI